MESFNLALNGGSERSIRRAQSLDSGLRNFIQHPNEIMYPSSHIDIWPDSNMAQTTTTKQVSTVHVTDPEGTPPPSKQRSFSFGFQIDWFGMLMALSSQTILLKIIQTSDTMGFLNIAPRLLQVAVWYMVLGIVIVMFSMYAWKCMTNLGAVKQEYFHAEKVNFFFTPWVTCMLLAMGAPSQVELSSRTISMVWCVLMAPILALEVKLYGQWIVGGKRRVLQMGSPYTKLGIIANFVGALMAGNIGWKEVAIFFWALGLAHYVVLFVTLYQNHECVLSNKELYHPPLFLIVAPPTTACLAWENIAGHYDMVCRISYFFGLFLFLTLVFQVKRFKKSRFSVGWWSYSFPVTMLAMAAIRHSTVMKTLVTFCIATLLIVSSTIIVVALIALTLYELFLNTWHGPNMLPNDMSIAIMSLDQKCKKHEKRHINMIKKVLKSTG